MGLLPNYSPPILERMGAVAVTATIMIIGAVLHTPTLIVGAVRQVWATLGLGAWLSLGYLVVGMSVLAYLLLSIGLRYLSPTQAALYISLQPIGTMVLASLIGQEPLSWQLVVGGLLTTAGMAYFRR